MILKVNDEYRIISDENQWVVQRFRRPRQRGGKRVEEWASLSYHSTLEHAVLELSMRRVRLIDSSVPAEISAALTVIRDEAVASITPLQICPAQGGRRPGMA